MSEISEQAEQQSGEVGWCWWWLPKKVLHGLRAEEGDEPRPGGVEVHAGTRRAYTM